MIIGFEIPATRTQFIQIGSVFAARLSLLMGYIADA
jgi:hypothetical protein